MQIHAILRSSAEHFKNLELIRSHTDIIYFVNADACLIHIHCGVQQRHHIQSLDLVICMDQ